MLSDHLTAALFAALIGAGTMLGWSAHQQARRSTAGYVTAVLVRAGCLFLLGLVTNQLGAQVVGILMHLALLSLLVALVVPLPDRAVVAIAIVSLVCAPFLRDAFRERFLALPYDAPEAQAWFWDVAGGGFYYQTPALLVFACAGILVTRAYRAGRLTPRRAGPLGGAILLAVGAVLAAGRIGVLEVQPYRGDLIDIVTNAALAVGVMLLCLALPTRVVELVRPLAWVGAMTLTLYVAQHAFLGWWVGPAGRASDDSWITLGALVIGSLLAAVVWRRLPLGGPFRRGPLEGLVATLSRPTRLRAGR